MYLEFNNIVLSNFIKISKVEETLGSSRKNISKEIASIDGEIYLGYKKEAKKIKFEFDINAKTDAEYENYLDILANALDTDEEAKLIYGRQDRYYWAVPDGSIDKKKITTGRGELTLTFKCHDPYAHSSTVEIFESDIDKIITVNNTGTKDSYPIVNIAFQNEAHFAQITNYDGRTILIGNRPSVDNESAKDKTLVLHDPCHETTNWLPSANVLDQETGRLVEGSITISENGEHIVPLNFGNTIDQKWHGPAVRRNLGANIENFRITARIRHNSFSEDGGKPPSTGNYKVTAKSLNFRSGPGTNYKVICGIPKNTVLNVTSISNGWCKTTYKNKTGYVSKSYVEKVTSNTKANNNLRNNIRNKLKTENKMGRVELYLFDQNAQKLGKVCVRDSERYFEYTQPEIWIGNEKKLHDGKNVPAPKTTTVKEDGKTVTKKVESGKYGDWNEYYGNITIERITKNNKQYWSLSITKIKEGKELSKPKLITKTALVSSDFPSGKLNHVVLWFGQHKDDAPCDDMALTDFKVWDLSKEADEADIINFAPGDELEVNMGNSDIILNGCDAKELIDIGSEFFSCPVGESQFIVKSDDEELYTNCALEKRWI